MKTLSAADIAAIPLEQRLAAYHENPDEGSPWMEVKQSILG